MESPTPETTDAECNSTVDASRPFHSVKEAVAIFGERVLLRGMQSPIKSLTSTIAKVASPSSEFAPSTEKPTGFVSPSSEKPTGFVSPSSEKPTGFSTESGTFDSSEFIQIPIKPSSSVKEKETLSSSDKPLNIGSKQAEDLSVYELTTPSPKTPENDNKIRHSRLSSEKGLSPSPSISSKEITCLSVFEPTPSPQILTNDRKPGNIVHGNDLVMMLMILKRLESELQETKEELKVLKDRGSVTEVALASLNAEFHKNMSKIAKVEAAEAAKAAAAKSTTLVDSTGNQDMGAREEEKRKCEVMVKSVDSPTLAQILSITDYDSYFGDSRKVQKSMKKKPIIPLVTDLFPWRKRSQPNNYVSAPFFSWQ